VPEPESAEAKFDAYAEDYERLWRANIRPSKSRARDAKRKESSRELAQRFREGSRIGRVTQPGSLTPLRNQYSPGRQDAWCSSGARLICPAGSDSLSSPF
jgi:hypothetical protein